jgi:ABC-type transport system substrate-binding protein
VYGIRPGIKQVERLDAAVRLQLHDVALEDLLENLDSVRLRQEPQFQVLASEVGGTRYALLFNTFAPPTDHQQVRQALLHAIDRQRIVDTAAQIRRAL